MLNDYKLTIVATTDHKLIFVSPTICKFPFEKVNDIAVVSDIISVIDASNFQLPCDPYKVGNGICDFECNRRYHNWDGGDCCNATVTDTMRTCFDPSSSHRYGKTIILKIT